MKEILSLLRQYNIRNNHSFGIIKFYDDGSGAYYADDTDKERKFCFNDEKHLISQLKEKKRMSISEIERKLGMDVGTLVIVED